VVDRLRLTVGRTRLGNPAHAHVLDLPGKVGGVDVDKRFDGNAGRAFLLAGHGNVQQGAIPAAHDVVGRRDRRRQLVRRQSVVMNLVVAEVLGAAGAGGGQGEAE